MVSRMPSPHRSEDVLVHRFGRTDAEAPTLLLMHGLTDSGRCWPDAVARWSADYRLLAWDARGHGESERFTAEELDAGVGETHLADAVDLHECLAADGVERPVIVGLSMGGGTAAAVAGARPDLVRAVVLEDPVLGGGRFSDERAAELAEYRVQEKQAALDDPEATLDEGRRQHPSWPESEYAPWRDAKLQTDVEVLQDHTTTVLTPWPDVAAAVAVPALIVLGADGIWSPEDRDRLRAVGNPNVEIDIVDGAEHCVRRDRADAFHAVVDPWVAKHLA